LMNPIGSSMANERTTRVTHPHPRKTPELNYQRHRHNEDLQAYQPAFKIKTDVPRYATFREE
jgi:hypothetical protein